MRTRWKEYGPSVEEEETYIAVKKNTSGSRPKELFEDLIVVSRAAGNLIGFQASTSTYYYGSSSQWHLWLLSHDVRCP